MRISIIASVTLLAAASIAAAHGVQTQITYNIAGNKIDTRSIIFTSANGIGQAIPINTVTAQRRAYIEPLLYSPIGAGTGWYARPDPFLTLAGLPEHPTGPGVAWQYDDGGTNALAGTGWNYSGSATRPNLANTAFGYKLLDGLKQWNGTSFVDPGAEQVQIILSDGTTSFTPTAINSVTTNDAAPFGTLSLGAITSRSPTNNPHTAVSFRLLGDGTTLADGDDGIYLLKLALSTTATVGNTGVAVGDSDPFYFLFTKNASYADAVTAASSLGISSSLIQGQVPEPTTLSLLGGCALSGQLPPTATRMTCRESPGATGRGTPRPVRDARVFRRHRSRSTATCGTHDSLFVVRDERDRDETHSSFSAMTAALMPTLAFAHDGPRVWVTAADGRLFTETSDDDYDPSVYSPAQVFTGELSPFFGTYTTQFPGYEAPRDGSGGVSDGTTVGFKIAGPLLTPSADGTHLVPTTTRFAGQANVPQLAITFPDAPPAQQAAFTRYTSAGVIAGYDFTSTISEHTHLAYTFLGDASSATSAGPDGLFVLPMVLTSPTLATSKWYFLSFKKNASDADASGTAALAQSMATARPGDTNFDGRVDFADLVTLAQHYSRPADQWWATGDFNFDGAVDFSDLVSLAQNYGQPSAFAADWSRAQSLVPEPAASCALIGALVGIGRRQRQK